MIKMRYAASVHTPGYQPSYGPADFETVGQAWEYLAVEREEHEDAAYDTEDAPSAVAEKMRARKYPGVVHGDSPGYDGPSDLGLVYEVAEIEEES